MQNGPFAFHLVPPPTMVTSLVIMEKYHRQETDTIQCVGPFITYVDLCGHLHEDLLPERHGNHTLPSPSHASRNH